MKTPIGKATTRESLKTTAVYNARWFASLIAGTTVSVLGAPRALAVDNLWNGSIDTSYNTPGNWSLGRVPAAPNGGVAPDDFDDAIINLASPFPLITADIASTPRDLRVGSAAGTTGRLDHRSGVASTGTNNWMFVGVAGGTGTYNLANTATTGGTLTGFGMGTGSMTVGNTGNGGRFYVGGDDGGNDAGNGTANVNTSGSLTMRNDLSIGNQGGTGIFNLDNGTVSAGSATSGAWTFVGRIGGTGTLNMGGGTLTTYGRYYIGDTGNGTVNLTGGTIAKPGTDPFIVGNGTAGTGVFNQNGGTVGTGNGDLWIGEGAGSNGTYNLSAGALNIGAWGVVGRDGGTATLNVTGGTLTKTGTGNFIVSATGTGTMVQSAGLVDIQSGVTWIAEQGTANGTFTLSGTGEYRTSSFILAVNTGATATANLNGGTLKVSQISGGPGTETVHFNGTQIVVNQAELNFLTAIDTATVDAGGLKINTNGFAIASSYLLAGTGGVVKSGTGTLSLSAANTYAGGNTVSAGKLALTNAYTGTGALAVADGASLGLACVNPLSATAPTNQLVAASASFGGAGATTLDLDLSTFGNPPVAPISVTGGLTVNGTLTVNIAGADLQAGIVPLISYGSKSGAGTVVLGSIPAGVQASIVEEPGNKRYVLNITSVGISRWDGTIDDKWDTTTANWADEAAAPPPGVPNATYANGDLALFNDEVSFVTDVILNGTVTPGGVIFDNSTVGYTLSGTGKISGAGGLIKRGSSGATIGTVNDYTGVTTVEGGILTVGSLANGGVASSLGAASAAPGNLVFAGGTLDYTGPTVTIDRGYTVAAPSNTTFSKLSIQNNVTVTGPVTSTAGGFTKVGPGTLTLTNAGPNLLGIGGFRVEEGRTLISGGTHSISSQMGLGSDSQIELAGATVTNTGDTNIGDLGGAPSTLTLSGATVYTTPNRVMSGMNSGTGAVVVSGTSQLKQTGGWMSIGQSTGGSLLVKDSGTVTVPGDFNISDLANSSGSMTLQDSGTINAGAVYFGKGANSTGTVTLTGGTFNGSAAAYVGRETGSTGTVTQTGGTIALGGNNEFFIGATGTGTWNQSAGTVNASGWNVIGRYPGGIGLLSVSGGTFNQGQIDRGFIVGEEGTGTLTISGGTVSSVWTNGIVIGNSATGDGTINLDGGTLMAKGLKEGAGGNSKFHFNGGLLKAAPGANAAFITGLDSVFVDGGGANIDTNGNNVAIATDLVAGTGSGGLTKTGAGTLLLDGFNTYTGATAVSAGTLGGTGSLAGSLSVAAGATLSPGDNGVGIFSAGPTTIAGTLAIDVDGLSSDQLEAAGTLNLTGATLAVSTLAGGATETEYVIATYTGATPGPFATVTGLPSGYVVDYAHNGNNIALVSTGASPYTTWIGGFFPGVTDPAIIGPAADPDQDGQTNAVEFALGGSPNSGGSRAKVYVLAADSSADGDTTKELLLTIAVRSGTPAFSAGPAPTATQDGFTYTIQGSTDLSSFPAAVSGVNPVTTDLPSAPAGYEYRTFSLGGSNGLAGKGFLRVQITP